jgi:hypothetical protein
MKKLKSEIRWLWLDLKFLRYKAREIRWLWLDLKFSLYKARLSAWNRLPQKLRHNLVAWEIGNLTTDAILSDQVVGEISVDDLLATMKIRELRAEGRFDKVPS